MSHLPQNIQKVIEGFSRLPGIGPKSAERLTFHLLKKPHEEITRFGEEVGRLKQGIHYCKRCFHLTVDELCGICQNEKRDAGMICVVEGPMDLLALEKANEYGGTYHVLHGIISPMDGVGPEELTIDGLVARVRIGGVKEIIIALNPSMEGEATASYITRQLAMVSEETSSVGSSTGIRITRIARGIPVGGHLEYADSQTLKRAFEGRTNY